VAGETILIVEDSPVSLKLTAAALRSEGYKVHIASTAEQALSTLRTTTPRLLLVDIRLPGMSGLELTRQVKQDARLRQTIVIALTALTTEEDKQRAREAGCDGYLTKPIDIPTLVIRVSEYLNPGKSAPPALADATPVAEPESLPQPPSFGLPESEMEDLRRAFIADGAVQSSYLVAGLDSEFDASKAGRLVHQWIGTAGMLGFTRISGLSREVETQLRTPPWNVSQLRESLVNLARGFAEQDVVAPEASVPDFIVQELSGKRVALIGFAELEAERMCTALERVGAKPRLFDANDPPDYPPIRECNLVIVHVRPETRNALWLAPEFLPPPLLPLMLIGARKLLLSLDPVVQSRAREFLIDAWQPEEALMRLSFALSRTAGSIPVPPAIAATAAPQESSDALAQPDRPPVTGRTSIVIADDDVTVRTLVRSALENEGMECQLASNGLDALQMVRDHHPQAAVLDINMPGMDGFEVLSAVRAEALPVRIILLTARQHQNDIVRGFSLGADDYIIKPFKPMELIARLKRLLVC
jgi:two-component system cell cycle response regulator DivK